MNEKRLWYCSVCGFYHTLDSVCPKTGQAYEEMRMEVPIAFERVETRKLTLPKVREKQ